MFSSIIELFYQYDIGCDVDKNKVLGLYLLSPTAAVDNKEFLIIEKFTNLHLSEENGEEFNTLQSINIMIGKYLLSLFIIMILFWMKEI